MVQWKTSEHGAILDTPTLEELDFCLPDDNIHRLTQGKRFQIRFEVEHIDGVLGIMEYGGFTLDLVDSSYLMRLSMYLGK